MVFLPHTNTVILLEPYCGTMTEPGLPVIALGPMRLHTQTISYHRSLAPLVNILFRFPFR